MKEKKNIDRLFQERFKDFEAHPAPEVWRKIEDRLDQKKKKRAVPLWWKLGGAAALLALLFFIGNLYLSPFGNDLQVDEQLVETEGSENATDENKTPLKNDADSVTDAVVSNAAENEEKTPENRSKSGENEDKLTDFSTEKMVSDSENSSAEGAAKTERQSREPQNQDAWATTTDEKSVKNAEKQANNTENRADNLHNNAVQNPISENAVAVNDTEKLGEDTQNPVKTDENQPFVPDKNKTFTDFPSNNDAAITDNEKTEEKTLEQIVQEEQAENLVEEATEDEKIRAKRWALSPTIAPVYYDSFGGSGIAPQFDSNSKEGQVNLSYGLLVSYAVNDKLTVRSGVNKIDLSYNTGEAILSTSTQTSPIQSLNFDNRAGAIQVKSAVRAESGNPLDSSAEIVGNNSSQSQGYVNQSLAYFEVPMELEYALVENRVGVQLIGGLSTLFLNDNALTFSDSNFKTALPESTNLNEVSFSTNIGLGLNYKFTDEIKFNLEPMFKYQLNAYKNSVSDFKPYYLGLYTGLSIKF